MVDADSLSGTDDESYDGDGNMFSDKEEFSEGAGIKRRNESDSDSNGNDDTAIEKGKKCKKKRKVLKDIETKKLHKPPTAEELNRLRETENLFHSNLFRRQIEEMLNELIINDKYKVRVNTWFEKFNDWLGKMEDDEEKSDLANSEWLKSLKLPVPIQRHLKGWYQFKKPLRSVILGSYATKSILGPGKIDIFVEIPASFFQKDDNLNTRYHVKRAIYLNELARHFKLMGDLVQEIRFACDEGKNLSPLLEIIPSGKLSKNTVFAIHLAAENTSFKQSRFAPLKNNLRPNWFNPSTKNESEDTVLPPTPEYNNSILRDLRMFENNEFVNDVIGKNTQLRDAVVLLKVWLKQRELHIGHGGFSGFLVSMIIAYLLHIRKINITMSSYQILRCVWSYLNSSDWAKNGITLCEAGITDNQPSLSEFHEQFPLVFVDHSGLLNLCAGMIPLVYQRCRDECEQALRCLDSTDVDSFQMLFMKPAPFSMLCDHYISIHEWKKFDKLVEANSPSNKKLDMCGNVYPQVREVVIGLVQKGLGQRAKRIFIKQVPRKEWPIDKKAPRSCSLTLGLLLDPDHCFAMVDKGPVADAIEAEDFRKFWQGISEVRRFKDGSITEAVIWKADTWEEKRLICRQVVKYLFNLKLGLGESDYKYVADELQSTLCKSIEDRSAKVLSQYEDLAKKLKDLTDLPLNILSIQGASPIFRHSEIYPPGLPTLSKKHKKERKVLGKSEIIDLEAVHEQYWCAPAEVIIQLGSSSKWPHDLAAVRRIRAAFNIKIAKVLKQKYRLVSHPYQDYTDVLTETCVFRLRIVYPGEIVLMKKTQGADGITKYVDTEESLKLEKVAIHLPKITSALRGLHSQHSSYGPACCLAKRWVRAHLFDEEHLGDVAIDLLVASLYLNPDPWEPPNQPQLAFLRFLYLLGYTNWSIDFVLLNFNQEIPNSEVTALRSFFDANRQSLPPLFIATSYDKDKSIWTKDGVSPVVLLRLINLCQLAHSLLITQLFDKAVQDFQALFQPSLSAFDAIITLNQFYIPKRQKSVSESEKGSDIIPVIDFDPVSAYVKELRESYGEWALFFYDPYEGPIVGVVWKPTCKETRDVKVSHLYGRYLDKKTNQLIVNVQAILEGFTILGLKLVKKVEVREDGKLVQFRF